MCTPIPCTLLYPTTLSLLMSLLTSLSLSFYLSLSVSLSANLLHLNVIMLFLTLIYEPVGHQNSICLTPIIFFCIRQPVSVPVLWLKPEVKLTDL